MSSKLIPDIVIQRLPLYLRTVQRLYKENRLNISSQELGEHLGLSAAQIRKDLSQFGEFGKQGTGYDTGYLSMQLQNILKVNSVWDIAVIGAGDIGNAIVRYQGFIDRGFQVKLIFDNDNQKIGTKIGQYIVQDSQFMGQLINENQIKIAMIAVPAKTSQDVADQLVDAGIMAILNYSPININVPPYVRLQHIDPVTHLQRMTYYL